MSSGVSTGAAVSPDSGEHWAAEGAWEVAPGIHRIPLPLPMDGLKAINVYVVQSDDGLTLIDGGWAIPVARELLDKCLRSIGSGFGDIRRFLVTHIHRDHFTMATVLGHEYGADVALGLPEKPGSRPAARRRSRRVRGRQPVQRGAPLGRGERGRRRVGARPPRGGPARPDRLGLSRHLARRRHGDRGRCAHDRRRPHSRPHAGSLRLRRPRRRAALRGRPRAADDHALDRLHRAARARPARPFHGVPHQGARATRPADPARARSGRAVLPRPRRRAARPPRAPSRAVPRVAHAHAVRRSRRSSRPTSAGPGTSGRTPSSTSSTRAWRRWRPRPTSTCSSPAARPRSRPATTATSTPSPANADRSIGLPAAAPAGRHEDPATDDDEEGQRQDQVDT